MLICDWFLVILVVSIEERLLLRRQAAFCEASNGYLEQHPFGLGCTGDALKIKDPVRVD